MIIQSTKVYHQEKLQPLQVEIEKDVIKGIYPYNLFKVDRDYGDLMILPGLVDIHNHGYDGGEANQATREWLTKWVEYLPSEGVTSTLATISAFPKAGLLKALNNIAEFIDNPVFGTNILGVSEEGPFICDDVYRGAQNADFMIVPTIEVIDEFNEACKGNLIHVMLAPEMLKGDYSVIDYCLSKGMKVSIGHTGADFKTCQKAISHGAISFTHTFNGMKGLHHREPGTAGAVLYFDNCYAELIGDGIHVNKYVANILAKVKGKDKLILVTDAVNIKGLKPGIYHFADKKRTTIVGEDGVGRLENGKLAGSCNKLNKVLNYSIKESKIDFVTAVNAATINPLTMLGINDRGLIKEGYKADIAVFDSNFETEEVYINGKTFKL